MQRGHGIRTPALHSDTRAAACRQPLVGRRVVSEMRVRWRFDRVAVLTLPHRHTRTDALSGAQFHRTFADVRKRSGPLQYAGHRTFPGAAISDAPWRMTPADATATITIDPLSKILMPWDAIDRYQEWEAAQPAKKTLT